MKSLITLALLISTACGGSSGRPPNVTPPAPITDPNYDPTFYAQFAFGVGPDAPANTMAWLFRQKVPPSLYINTHDVEGGAVPQASIDVAAHHIAAVLPLLTGGWQIPAITYGPMPLDLSGTVEVKWSPQQTGTVNICAEALIGGQTLTLYYRVKQCSCNGAISAFVVKHEFGHILGFNHTDQPTDLMAGSRAEGTAEACDMNPSAREQFHARLAYAQPVGSLVPR